MNKNDIAIGVIDSRLKLLDAGETSAAVHAETSMAIEMAHSLGAIDVTEYGYFRAWHNRIIGIQHRQTLELMRSYA
jgi:uncharacterized protein YfaT (DUF1175 family)